MDSFATSTSVSGASIAALTTFSGTFSEALARRLGRACRVSFVVPRSSSRRSSGVEATVDDSPPAASSTPAGDSFFPSFVPRVPTPAGDDDGPGAGDSPPGDSPTPGGDSPSPGDSPGGFFDDDDGAPRVLNSSPSSPSESSPKSARNFSSRLAAAASTRLASDWSAVGWSDPVLAPGRRSPDRTPHSSPPPALVVPSPGSSSPGRYVHRTPPPPPRVDPFARLPPTYSGPGGTHPRLVDQSPPANDHLRPAERDRASWATEVGPGCDSPGGDAPGGVVRWTYRPGDDPGGGCGGDDDGVRSGDLDRPGVRPVNDKQTDSAAAVDAAARRRLEKLRALFGDDSDGDDGDLFNVEPDVTPPGTKNETTKGLINKVEDLCTTDDATVGDSPADDNREPKETVLPENVPENVPEKVVKAATDAPATLVDVAKASIAQDVASMKRTKDEARAELESLRARLKVLEASLVDGDTTAVFSAGDTAGVSGDATDASKPTASKVGEATAATPPPPAVAVEALD